MVAQLEQIGPVTGSRHFQQRDEIFWARSSVIKHQTTSKWRLSLNRSALSSTHPGYRVNDSPQEQEREASGLLKVNPVRFIDFSKSISVPLRNR